MIPSLTNQESLQSSSNGQSGSAGAGGFYGVTVNLAGGNGASTTSDQRAGVAASALAGFGESLPWWAWAGFAVLAAGLVWAGAKALKGGR
jgi:hypothetical protein